MKLHYFDIYARAEPIRFLLSHAKVEYEDVLVPGWDLSELRAQGKLEFNQVPVLEKDGKFLSQSWAILRYLGRTYGYYPESSPETAYTIDSTIDAIEDFLTAFFRFNFEPNADKKAVYKENLLKMVPIWVAAIEKRLEKSTGKYIAGDKITIADFALAAVAFDNLLNEANPLYAETLPFIKDHETLKKYSAGLKEELGSYLASRPSPRMC